MATTRSMSGTLAILLLCCAKLEAFSLSPARVIRVARSSRRGGTSAFARAGTSSTPAAAARRSLSKVSSSPWIGGDRMERSLALSMADVGVVAEVPVLELEDREFQLEELEDRDVAETSVVLNKDGTVSAGATNGPIPLSVRGKWTFDGKEFRLELHREFDAAIPYMVSRVMTGYVEEVLTATDTLIITGDIEMEEMDVGFFKMISAPSDILDSLEHLDQQMAKKRN